MSSNIRISRICEFCGKEFEAKTTVTKTCSDHCAKRLYKKKQKEKKIEVSNAQTQLIKLKPMEELRSKEFLTVRDLSKLLNCSIRTAYNIISNGNIKAFNLAKRKTLIKRSDVDKLFS
jgi:excisionase family DNA binding protein